MTSLSQFCAQVGIDEAAARQALKISAVHEELPWYMQAVLGIGAWITAIAGLFFVWAVMDLVFGVDDPNFAVALAGAAIFGASLWLLHRRPHGAFLAHAATAFAVAGSLLAAAGIGVPAESLWQAAAAMLPFCALAIWQQRSPLLQFLVVSAGLIVAVLAAWDHWENVLAGIPAICIPFGAALLLHPPRHDVRPAAFALLLVPQILEIAGSALGNAWSPWLGWPARLALLAAFVALFAGNWRRLAEPRSRVLALAGAAAAGATALVLPAGATAALVLLLLAYTLASRSLAAIAAVMEIYFIWLFYDDLGSTLLAKSIMLMSAGSVLLICYALLIAATRGGRAA
ncbi:MAG TPA: DUF4401 domain-containing protein [Dongiaceae bacterium]|nr:DUF4401 domain-containing protein [Dongiaceae bacterium]